MSRLGRLVGDAPASPRGSSAPSRRRRAARRAWPRPRSRRLLAGRRGARSSASSCASRSRIAASSASLSAGAVRPRACRPPARRCPRRAPSRSSVSRSAAERDEAEDDQADAARVSAGRSRAMPQRARRRRARAAPRGASSSLRGAPATGLARRSGFSIGARARGLGMSGTGSAEAASTRCGTEGDGWIVALGAAADRSQADAILLPRLLRCCRHHARGRRGDGCGRAAWCSPARTIP